MNKTTLKASLLLASLLSPIAAHADEWGCQVLLCLANPGGPEQFAECVPPIQKLWAALHKPHPDPFPTCETAGAGNVAYQSNEHYDKCPDNTVIASVGSWVKRGSTDPKLSEALVKNWDGSSSNTGDRACVGALTSTNMVWDGDNYYAVNVYDTVTWLPYQDSRSIDVNINGQLKKRIFY